MSRPHFSSSHEMVAILRQIMQIEIEVNWQNSIIDKSER